MSPLIVDTVMLANLLQDPKVEKVSVFVDPEKLAMFRELAYEQVGLGIGV